MSLAIYGGSFDPPHAAHLLVASWVLACAPVDELLFVPTAEHALGKSAGASFEDRVTMVSMIASRLRGASVSRLEETLPRPSRTHTMLEALRRERPGVAMRLVVGTDIAAETSRWHRWDDIVALAPPIWVGRTGHPSTVPTAMTFPDVSSTEIRRRLADGDSVEGLVPLDVGAYIVGEGLYGSRR